MPVLIDEVLRRVALGRHAPYLCRADDGQLYCVLHRGGSRRERAAEALAVRLARALGLPVAAGRAVEVPAALVAAEMGEWLAELPAGPGWAWRYTESTEPTPAQLRQVPAALRARIAAFDWWLHNAGRTVAPSGVPAGLRWRTDPPGPGHDDPRPPLLLIDHRLAFDPRFDAARFARTHVFGTDFARLAADFIDRERLRQDCVQALAMLEAEPDGLRGERGWGELLARCRSDDAFWTAAP